ncbi:MAG: ABC transporter permease [Chloroflexi bacterium]|nr:MAG: ABC transporter permease [Chloroflexota bacterium]
MNKIIQIAKHEYWSNLKRKGFLFAAFGVPVIVIVLMVIIFALQAAAETTLEDLGSVGYVDYSGVLAEAIEKPDVFLAFADETQAQEALDAEEIGAYFVVSEDYLTTGKVTIYSPGSASKELSDAIDAYLLANLRVSLSLPSDIPTERFADPVNVTYFIMDTGREASGSSVFLAAFMLPVIFLMIFMMGVQISGSFLMAGVVEEKTNRIIELLITSVTPFQLLVGKMVGLGLLGLTQLLIWVVAGLAVLSIGSGVGVEFFADITIQPDMLVIMVIYFILSYFLLASVMAGIGAVSESEQESRQYAGILSLIMVIPYFFIMEFMTNPHGALPVILTLVPITAPIAAIMRMSFGTLPFEQLLLSYALLVVATVFITWLSARVFRWAILLYGSRPRISDIFRAMLGKLEIGVTTNGNGKRKTKEVVQ